MKTLISKIAFILLLQSFANTLFAHVVLDYPQGGETVTVGQTMNIQWHIAIAHNTLNWDLLYSVDGGNSWEAIQMDLPPGSLSYTWIVPSTITSEARVSVIQDNSEQDYQDESANFNIIAMPVPPAIVVGAMNIIIESNVNSQEDAIQDWLDNHGGASANGFCGDLIWTNNYLGISNGCGSTGSALVSFTATDPCGSTETVATVTVNDTSPPVLNSPATPLVVECDGNGNLSQFNTWIQMNGGATASDAGGNVTWDASFTGSQPGCGVTSIISMLFTAIDECDNSISTSANFIIEDHVAPVIQTGAQDIIIECGLPNTQLILQNWLLNSGGAMASDICGSVTWTNDFPVVVDTCQASTIVPVTFTAVDDCGNSNVTTASVTLVGIAGTSNPGLPELDFILSPNPVSDILKIEFDKNKVLPVNITLYDTFGHKVLALQEAEGEIYIPVSGFMPGIYFLKAETSYGVYTRKVLIE